MLMRKAAMAMSDNVESPQASALFLSAFFDELIACGVRDVVVSPGSRSTPLAMVAHASGLNLYVDIDERGAGFFALGMAKAVGRPVALICTSGTAVANYYPAVLEAESSRVPLIVLTGDRPPRLQNLGAPQTCDQLKAYGDHVRHFQQMPLPGAKPQEIAFARQMAKTAVIAAAGAPAATNEQGQPFYGCVGNAGPVHINFPFDEPLRPDLTVEGLFEIGRSQAGFEHPLATASSVLSEQQAQSVLAALAGRRVCALVGEGACFNSNDVARLVDWAQRFSIPLLADPLSGLRSSNDELVIDAYDSIFANGEQPGIDCFIRFGRYPVSKGCFTSVCSSRALGGLDEGGGDCGAMEVSDGSGCGDSIAATANVSGIARPVQIVVDAVDTRDFNAATDLFVRCEPMTFVDALCAAADGIGARGFADTGDARDSADVAGVQRFADVECDEVRRACAHAWVEANAAAHDRIGRIAEASDPIEAVYVSKALELAPEGSLVFAANSMTIRLIDAVYLKSSKRLSVLCNRGLNGIDGTVSSALGAAQAYRQTTFITGDLTMLHDLNALALQRELLEHHGGSEAPSIVIVLLNNGGGGIFETLPQKSDDACFERLFLTPQRVDFRHAAHAFGVACESVRTIAEFEEAYKAALGVPGISMIEVPFAIGGLSERFGRCR